MRKYFLYFLLIFLFFIPINILISQTINKWMVIDKGQDDFYYMSSGYINNMAVNNKNDIILFSKKLYQKESSTIVYSIFKMIKLTDEATKKETIYYDTSQINDRWRDIIHPTKNFIAVVGDSLEFLDVSGYKMKSFALLMMSKDGGETWRRKIYDSNFVFQWISMCDSNNGIIYGYDVDNIYNKKSQSDMNRYLLITNNGWQSFEKIQLPNEYVSDIKCFSPNKFVLVHSNYLSFTDDAGKTWRESEYLPEYVNITDVEFIGDKTIWVICSINDLFNNPPTGKIFKSIDGGSHWQTLNIDNTYAYDLKNYIKISFADSLNGTISSNNLFFLTNNGGKTWSKEYPPFDYKSKILYNTTSLCNLYYSDTDFVLSTYMKGYILKRTKEQNLKKPYIYEIVDRNHQNIDNVKISWTPIKGAINYKLKVDTNNINIDNFKNVIIDTTISDTSYIFHKLIYNSRYNIIIKALGKGIESDWSYCYFETIHSKDAFYSPELIYPNFYSKIKDNKVTLLWHKVTTADKYFLDLMSNTGEDLFTGFVRDTFLTISGLKPNNIYSVETKSYSGKYFAYPKVSYFVTDAIMSVENSKISRMNNNLFIYPNPARDKFNLTINSSLFTNAKINIYNVLGLKVKQLSTELVSGKNNIPINTFDLPNGLYFIKVLTGNILRKGMFIKN